MGHVGSPGSDGYSNSSKGILTPYKRPLRWPLNALTTVYIVGSTPISGQFQALMLYSILTPFEHHALNVIQMLSFVTFRLSRSGAQIPIQPQHSQSLTPL